MKKLLTYLLPLLNSKEDAKRFHQWFALFWDPCYVINLHYVKEIHWLNCSETRTLIKNTKKYLFEDSVDEEITKNPVSVPLSIVTEE